MKFQYALLAQIDVPCVCSAITLEEFTSSFSAIIFSYSLCFVVSAEITYTAFNIDNDCDMELLN